MSREVHVRFCESGGVRFPSATHLVILVDAYRRHDWLLKAVNRRLREELAKLQIDINEGKSRFVDLAKGQSFGFLGFEFRCIRSLQAKCGRTIRPSSSGALHCCESSKIFSDASTPSL